MALGEFRDRITITSQTLQEYGEGDYIPVNDTILNVWAKVTQMNSEEVINSGLKQGVNNYKILIRFDSNVKTNSEITYNDEALQIKSVKHDRLKDRTEIIASNE